jgi:hypothetical protein
MHCDSSHAVLFAVEIEQRLTVAAHRLGMLPFPFFELMKLNGFKIDSQICGMQASANTQASFAFAAAVNAAAFFRTNSSTLSGACAAGSE